MIAVALTLALAQTPVDIYRLPIGPPGEVRVELGLTDARTGKPATLEDLAVAARGHRYVLVGESHDNADHHRFQAAVIEALVADGRRVSIGLEMFTRPAQVNLTDWIWDEWTAESFIARSRWEQEWGMDFALYEPIFRAAQAHRLPLVALNVPRSWVRTVSREGLEKLTQAQRDDLPPIALDNADHRSLFSALMGGHPVHGDAGERVYAAQSVWDEAMADSAIRFFRGRATDERDVMVIVAGSGHTMYGVGIGWRLARREQGPILHALPIDGEPREVSRGLSEFIWLGPYPGHNSRVTSEQ